jgi:hypothetical protein
VQVFETTIRGLGGLLSAHLFATNALPGVKSRKRYNDELLHLAEDLGRRLLPALTESPTGIPYPRINLRHGLPHGVKNPRYYTRAPSQGGIVEGMREHFSQSFWSHPRSVKREKPDEEVTETCTAGAGSLVLEFTTLSRLVGDPVFEDAAKNAFDAIWSRRSSLGLLGTGIDAESGLWAAAHSGIGAGVDSFFEYAFKSYVLMADNDDEGYFLSVWEEARAAIEKHVLVKEPVAWYNNVHLSTGAGIPGGTWIDSLGAFFPGVLAGAGSSEKSPDGLELAIKGNLVYSALWNRYHALPERYNTRLSTIEGGLSWYPGRPEFIESTYLLYRTTKDPFWLYVGEMAMRDLRRRCWGACGWAGLQDVRTGETQDRMESFWLGETWMYLFLLFDEGTSTTLLLCHPSYLIALENSLHKLDAPWVFSTEGHPLVLPRHTYPSASLSVPPRTCSPPPQSNHLFSPTAAREDLFHSAYFAKLHLISHPTTATGSSLEELYISPSNSTLFPYTLPPHLIPPRSTCAPLPSRDQLELIFPDHLFSAATFSNKIQRVPEGVRILSLDSLRLSLLADSNAGGAMRVNSVSGTPVGKGEKVFISRDLVAEINDQNFLIVEDKSVVDLVLRFAPGVEEARESMVRELLSRWGLGSESEREEGKIVEGVVLSGDVFDLTEGGVYFVGDNGCEGVMTEAKGQKVVVVDVGGCGLAEKIANVPDGEDIKILVVDGKGLGKSQGSVGEQRNRWGRRRRNELLVVAVHEEVEWEEVTTVEVKRRGAVKVGGKDLGGVIVR